MKTINYKVNPYHNLLLKKTSRTLYLSFSILPEYIRFMISYGYLIARSMDSVIDENKIESDDKIRFLNEIKKAILESNFTIRNDFLQKISNSLKKWEKELVIELNNIIDYFKKSSSDREIRLMRKLINGISRGMEIDIKRFCKGDGYILNMKELDIYTSLVGGIPALYWYDVAKIYKPDIFRANLYLSAYRIGKALQYTNILKDLSEDLKVFRCYIPKNYLNEKKVQINDLIQEPSNIKKIKDFINSIILVCIDYLDESEKFISSINEKYPVLKLSLIWPVYWAMDSLYLVSIKNPLKSKIKISKIRVYKTILKSPLYLSNFVFSQGYRFRRETLLLTIHNGD